MKISVMPKKPWSFSKLLPARMNFDFLHPTDNIEKHGGTKHSLLDWPVCH